MIELDWLRAKAKHVATETMVITPAEAEAVDCEAGTYTIERFAFCGTLPFRMAEALRGSKLAEGETLRLGPGPCDYYRSIITKTDLAE